MRISAQQSYSYLPNHPSQRIMPRGSIGKPLTFGDRKIPREEFLDPLRHAIWVLAQSLSEHADQGIQADQPVPSQEQIEKAVTKHLSRRKLLRGAAWVFAFSTLAGSNFWFRLSDSVRHLILEDIEAWVNPTAAENQFVFKDNLAGPSPQISDLLKNYGVKSIEIPMKSRTGEHIKLHAWYVPPDPGMPTVLISNGLDARLSDWDTVLPPLVVNYDPIKLTGGSNFGFLLYEYPGNGNPGGSSGTPSVQNYLDSLTTCSDYLRNQLNTDYNQQILMGYSMGCVVTVNHAGRHAAARFFDPSIPDYKAIALVTCPESFKEVYNDSIRSSLSVPSWVTPPASHFPDIFDTKPWIEEIRAPVAVFHGDSDQVVPTKREEMLVNTLRQHNPNVTYYHYKGLDHYSILSINGPAPGPGNPSQVQSDLLTFFRQYGPSPLQY